MSSTIQQFMDPYMRNITGGARRLSQGEDEEKRKRDAISTLFWLQFIQLTLSLIMLGGYARITGTTLNAFSPKTLDQAFEEDHLAITMTLIMVTSFFVAVDFMYFWALTARDAFDCKKKRDEYENAKEMKNTPDENTLSTVESREILDRTIKAHRNILANRKAKIIKVIQDDIFIRQLLIQCDIHQKNLLEAYENPNNQKDIITLLEEYSDGVSLKDYQFLHKEHQNRTRNIEYIQALKVPLRFTSILLLLEGRAFTCPDLLKNVGVEDTIPGYYQFILAGSLILWAITCYAYKLEFKKNDINIEYDKDIRRIKSTHHNALLATTILALERKTRNDTLLITKAPDHVQDNKFWGRSFTDIVSYKWLLPAFLLGPLGRRPFTIFALSGEKSTPDAQAIVGLAVFLLVIADLYYVRLSIKEETWELENQEDRKHVLKACEAVEGTSSNPSEMLINATEDEKKLHAQLCKGEKAVVPHAFKDEHPYLAGFKGSIDKLMFAKFGLRAASLAFSIPKFFGGDKRLNELHLGSMGGNEVLMLVAGIAGMVLGYLLQCINTERDRRLRPSKEDKENYLSYTQNASLFFYEPIKDVETSIKRSKPIEIQGETWHKYAANSPSLSRNLSQNQGSL